MGCDCPDHSSLGPTTPCPAQRQAQKAFHGHHVLSSLPCCFYSMSGSSKTFYLPSTLVEGERKNPQTPGPAFQVGMSSTWTLLLGPPSVEKVLKFCSTRPLTDNLVCRVGGCLLPCYNQESRRQGCPQLISHRLPSPQGPKIWVRGTTATVNSRLAVEGLGGRCQTQVLCTKAPDSCKHANKHKY